MNADIDKNLPTITPLPIAQVQRRTRSCILERGSNYIHGDET